jgi:O-antigen/teichoic acid export membrane protein
VRRDDGRAVSHFSWNESSDEIVAPDVISGAQPEALQTQEFRRQMGTVSRHSSVFFAGTVFTAALGYLFKVYLARTLDARALGIFALGITMVSCLNLFGGLGLPRTAARYVAAYCAREKFDLLRGFLARSLLALLTSSVLLGIVLLLAGPWVADRFYHTPEIKIYLPLFALMVIAGTQSNFLGQVLAGFKNVARRTVVTSFIGTPVTMIVTIVLITTGLGLAGYVLAQVIGSFLVLALMVRTAWRLTPSPARSFSGTVPSMEKEVIAFSGSSLGLGLLELLKTQSDRIAVGFYLDARRVGIYSVVATLITMVALVQRSVNQIFASSIADLHARDDHELLKRMFQTVTKWVVGLTFPFAFALIVYAREFMQIFGRGFETAWPVLIIGTVAGLVDCGVGSSGTLLLMSGRQNLLVKIQVVTAVLMVALNVLLVPRRGIVGAGLATALTVAVTNLWFLVGVRRELKFYPYKRSFLRLAPPLAASVAILVWLHSRFPVQPAWLGIALALPSAYAVFFGIASVWALDEDDRVIARAVWARLRPSGKTPG